MNIHDHAELALLNVEYAAADCNFLLKASREAESLKQLGAVGRDLAVAKKSLESVVDELESGPINSAEALSD